MEKPKRTYEMVVAIGSDTLEDLVQSLGNIQFSIYEYIEKGHSNPHVCTSGSPSSGYNFSLVKTDTADHQEYFKKLVEYLEEIK